MECSKSPFCETPVSSHDDDGAADDVGDNDGHDDDDGCYLLSDYSLAGSRLSTFLMLIHLIFLTTQRLSPL